jgi:hypothetical protein
MAPDPSADLTPDSENITLTKDNPSGVLQFKCASTVKGQTLEYGLSGTDKV